MRWIPEHLRKLWHKGWNWGRRPLTLRVPMLCNSHWAWVVYTLSQWVHRLLFCPSIFAHEVYCCQILILYQFISVFVMFHFEVVLMIHLRTLKIRYPAQIWRLSSKNILSTSSQWALPNSISLGASSSTWWTAILCVLLVSKVEPLTSRIDLLAALLITNLSRLRQRSHTSFENGNSTECRLNRLIFDDGLPL